MFYGVAQKHWSQRLQGARRRVPPEWRARGKGCNVLWHVQKGVDLVPRLAADRPSHIPAA